MSPAATWRTAPGGTELDHPPLSARFGPNGPSHGLLDLRSGEGVLVGALFTAATPHGPLGPATDDYVRGGDHVSIHAPTEGFPFRTELAWSVATLGLNASAVMLTVSLQTDLLDTRPDLALATSAAATALDASRDVWRLTTAEPATVVVAPHPSDAAETESAVIGHSTVLRLSPPFLEKGVIRRCRVAALVLPAGAEPADVRDALDRFAATPLPLTA